MNTENTVVIDNQVIELSGEKNLLEVIRKAEIDLPTFCYHSELSVYGACRLCIVDVEGMGIVASCSTAPRPGMKVKTQSDEIRRMRRMSIELTLASHNIDCPSCSKNSSCKLMRLAVRLGADSNRYAKMHKDEDIDTSSHALVRDPNKCILCGDCVRVCHEIQGVGAIDFTGRGHDVAVRPAFDKKIADVECVDCGQCAAVCPVGAIAPKSQINDVWNALYDKETTVVAQIAPAVRVALGEAYGIDAGRGGVGMITAALKRMGFDYVFDTSFAADLTVWEEATEFAKRISKGEHLPQFTSCCPAWVKFAEQYHPTLLPHLSSCKSPQQMFGSVAKSLLPERLGIDAMALKVVSIMPCTAKKNEARLEKHCSENGMDVDFVLSTQELITMIDEVGIQFANLSPAAMDMPFSFKTGAGVIFGSTGGVSEAVLRFLANKSGYYKDDSSEFLELRDTEGVREATVRIGTRNVKLAMVYGLKNADMLAQKVRNNEVHYDLVEVMACPLGCVGGAGQPVSTRDILQKRRTGLYEADRMLQFHQSRENPIVSKLYAESIGEVGNETAHRLLHTRYQNRKRIQSDRIRLMTGTEEALSIKVCVGTNCYLKGAQDLLYRLIKYTESRQISTLVRAEAGFCFESCNKGPVVTIGETVIEQCTFDKAIAVVDQYLEEENAATNTEEQCHGDTP